MSDSQGSSIGDLWAILKLYRFQVSQIPQLYELWRGLRRQRNRGGNTLGKAGRPKVEPETRTCSEPGCTAILRHNNKSGRCTKHHYVKKSNRKSPTPKRRGRPSKFLMQPIAGPGEIEITNIRVPGAPERYAIEVSEKVMDLLWAELLPKQKAQALQTVLGQ